MTKFRKYWFILLLIVINASCIYAQNDILQEKISISLKNITIHEALAKITNSTGYSFTYEANIIDANKIITESFKNQSIKNCLNKILCDSSLQYQVYQNHIIIKEKQTKNASEYNIEFSNIKTINIHAKVIDSETLKALPFALAGIKSKNIGTITNEEGIFILKISKKFINEQICISYIGYNNKCIPIINILNNDTVIKLKRKYISVQEIIIRNTDPNKLIIEALKKIKNNYQQKPVYLTTFYREKVKQNEQYMFLSEAVMKVYKTSYSYSQNDLLKILKYRSYKNIGKQDSIQLKIKSGLKTALILDIVKNKNDFINENYLAQYQYHMTNIQTFDGNLAYVINFEPQRWSDNALFSGQIYINIANKAIIGADYKLNTNKLHKINKQFIIKKEKSLNVQLKQAKYHVSYNKWNTKYYLKHVKADLKFRVKKKRKLFATHFTTSLEMAVIQIDTLNVYRFKRKEIDKINTIFADEQRTYDENFWEDYNYIKPEDNWKQAISKLQLKLQTESTDNQ